ncbi:MAG TPA: hypothetical protein VKF38_12550 [Anaerolineaceae bacterium]|nr:hypothetical protein [Anaerolineaceae bacterium]
MVKLRSVILFSILLCASFILADCAAGNSGGLSLAKAPSATLLPSDTPFPTALPTDTPSPTVTPTQIPSNTPTATQTPTPTSIVDFSKLKIINIGFLDNWQSLITFRFPDTVKGQYFLIVQDNKQYKCTLQPKYPKNLYCFGPLTAIADNVDIALYLYDSSTPVYQSTVFVPYPTWALP